MFPFLVPVLPRTGRLVIKPGLVERLRFIVVIVEADFLFVSVRHNPRTERSELTV